MFRVENKLYRLLLLVLVVATLSGGCGEQTAESVIDGDAFVDGDADTDFDRDAADGDIGDGDAAVDGDFQPQDGDIELPDGDNADGDGLDGDDDYHSEMEGDGDAEPEIERITLDLVEGCNPFSTSEECLLPFPNMWFMSPDSGSATGFRGDFPEDMIPNKDGDSHFDIHAANVADGASPVSPILVHLGSTAHPDILTAQDELEESLAEGNPIAVFNLETGQRVLAMTEMDLNVHPRYPNRYALIIRPLEPMQMGARHAVVLTKALTDTDGNFFESPEAFAVLRDKIYTTNARIENVRQDYENLFDFLSENGYARDELLLAWDFVVASQDYIMGSMLSMRAETLELTNGEGLGYRIESISENPNTNVSRIVFGQFEAPTFLTDDNTFDYDENHHPVLQETNREFPFTLIVPKMAETAAQPLPLVVFGHGIFGTGRDYLTGSLGRNYIQPLAEQLGVVIVATDWIGLSAGDMDLIINEVISDLNKIGLVTDRLQQSLVNNLTLTELATGALNADDEIWSADHDLIDANRVFYFGVSLGGIQGASFMALSPQIERTVLVVPGGGWSTMLPRSYIWADIQLFFQAEYPDPLVRQIAIAFLQARFDHSDPVNLAFVPNLNGQPVGKRKLLMQEAIGDCLIPNMSTELLARALGVSLLEPAFRTPAGFDTLNAPTNEPVMVQYLMPDRVEANPPPDGNLAPTTDNGVHYYVVFLSNVFQQVTHFLETGETISVCEGVCDPE
jgi:pimeloyl-ACP methyl ester carboxylesterase